MSAGWCKIPCVLCCSKTTQTYHHSKPEKWAHQDHLLEMYVDLLLMLESELGWPEMINKASLCTEKQPLFQVNL